jgi:hypothetical protein
MQQKVSVKEKRIIPWRIIAISILAVFTLGGCGVYSKHASGSQTAKADTDNKSAVNDTADNATPVNEMIVMGMVADKKNKTTNNSQPVPDSSTTTPDSSSANEAVATGYSSQKKDADTVASVHPNDGWSNFKKYLNKSAVSPDGKTGVVKLSLVVDHSGTVTSIRVVKGLTAATNKKAIDLINNGPGWVGKTSGDTEKVTVRVIFAK